ncbi:MAG: LapA family protein [Pseudomonadota bacterium]
MKKLIFAIVMALILFIILNLIYCNLDATTLNYRLVFKFAVPYLFSLQSVPLPVGFVLLISFSAGMIIIALLEALPSFFKTLEIRAKNRKIRQLERELTLSRSLYNKEKSSDLSGHASEFQGILKK